jgi:hypothetical protein
LFEPPYQVIGQAQQELFGWHGAVSSELDIKIDSKLAGSIKPRAFNRP